MQSRIALKVLIVTLALFLGAGNTASAQTSGSKTAREKLQEACDDGDTSACVRLDLAKRMRRDEDGNITFAPRDSITPSKPKPQTAVVAEEASPQPLSQAPQEGVSTIWKWIAIPLLALFALFVYGMFKVGPEEKKPAPTPALKRPAPLKGVRTSQGDLQGDPEPERQLMAWGTSDIKAWLKKAAEDIRPKVTNQEVLALCDSKETFVGEEGAVRFKAARVAREDKWNDTNTEAWQDANQRYSTLISAHEGITGAAYAVGLMLWETGEGDHKTILDLFRLDADRDFIPSAVNFHGYVSGKNLRPDDYMGANVLEAYLRQAFDIGAPDGHYHIATQVLHYYLWTCPDRADDGYVAAALRRVQAYSRFEARVYLDRIEAYPEAWNVDDKSVSTDGMMYEQQAAASGPMQ